jgi:hypothetical protein
METQNHKILVLNGELMKGNYWNAVYFKRGLNFRRKGPSASIPHFAL